MLINNIRLNRREHSDRNPRKHSLAYRQVSPDSFEKAHSPELKFSGKREDFLAAIKAGNAEQALSLLRDERSPDALRDQDRNTGLIQAAYYNKLNVAKKLLTAGSSLEAANKKGNTAWMVAAQKGNTSLLEFLLSQMKQQRRFVQLLNTANNDGNTAIMVAAAAGQYNAVKLLKKPETDLTIRNQAGQTVFDIAELHQYHRIYSLLKGEQESAVELANHTEATMQDTQPSQIESAGVTTTSTNAISPERTLIELFKRACLLSERADHADLLREINSIECKEHFVNRLKREMAKDPNQTPIIRNKLCYLYSKETLQQAKDFWNDIAKKVFQEPIGVLAGLTGLHQVLGMDDIKQDLLVQVILPLANNDPDHNSLVILHGPPGSGKTLIANCVAEHMDYPISRVKASKLLTNSQGRAFYGEASRRISDIFEQARAQAPVVLFFDEFDSIARRRSEESGNSTSVDTTELINEINATIDFNKESPKKVLLIGATNCLEHLDDAISRAERSYNIEVPPCNDETKLAIIKREIQTRHEGVTLDQSLNIETFAAQLVNSNMNIMPSDIKAALKHARKIARYRNQGILSENILQTSLNKLLEEKSRRQRQMPAQQSTGAII